MRNVIFAFGVIILLASGCGNMSTPCYSFQEPLASDSSTTYMTNLRPRGRVDTLVIKVEALNIEVLETCFNLNYVPVKLKPNE